MKLYVYSTDIPYVYFLVAETGEILANHVCSNKWFAKGDLYENKPDRIKGFKEKFGECECLHLGEDDMTEKRLLQLIDRFYSRKDDKHMRLIDLDVAIKDARANYGDVHDAVIMEHFLNAQPTVDAAPVVHGRWIVAHGNPTPYCSQCRKEAIRTFLGGYAYSEHCPHCGAKMDLPDDGE